MIGDIPVSMYDSGYHVIYPSERGVEDVYSNLQDCYGRNSVFVNLTSNGIIISNDGRYAVIPEYEYWLEKGMYLVNPFLIDLSTGEMFLTATYERKTRNSDSPWGAVMAACFSQDSGSMYYVLAGNSTEDACALYRYGIDSAETELCCSMPYSLSGSRMFECADGSLILMEDGYRRHTDDELPGLVRIRREGQEWKCEKQSFRQPYLTGEQAFDYSDHSGYALACVGGHQARQKPGTEFTVFRPENEETFDWSYAIQKGTNQIVRRQLSEQETVFDEENCYRLNKMLLSPDGYYAAAYVSDRETRTYRLFLIRLETLECVEVSGVAQKYGADALGFAPIMMWNLDGILLRGEGGTKLYRIR